MALDGEQGDEEGQVGNEEETGAEHPHDAVQQPFPDGADKEDAPGDQPDEQGPDTATPEEGPLEEGELQPLHALYCIASHCSGVF